MIAAVVVFLFYINSGTVRINRQLKLAQRYLLEEEYEQAIAAFEIVIEIDPKNVDAYLGLAEAYVSADELGNAVSILEKAAEQTDSDEILAMLRTTEAQRAAIDNVSKSGLAVERTERIEMLDGSYKIINCDSDGKMIKEEDYNADDTLNYYIIYSYDNNRNQIKCEQYNANNTLDYYTIQIYDSNKNWIKTETYSENGTLDGYFIYISYDNNGNPIKAEEYRGDGTLYGYNIRYYDSNGNVIKYERWRDGTLVSYDIYSYDSNGNKMKAEYYNGDSTLSSCDMHPRLSAHW